MVKVQFGMWVCQVLRNRIKKSLLFCFCKFSCLLDLTICFCLKKAGPWLEFRIKFNRYSIRSFQRLDLITCKSIFFSMFNWVSMSNIPCPPLQIERWARWLGGRIFSVPKKSHVLSMSFLIHLGIVYIWPVKRIWNSVPDIIFFINFTFFVSIGVIKDRITKLTPSILMENCDQSIFPGWSILFLYAPTHEARLLENLSSS